MKKLLIVLLVCFFIAPMVANAAESTHQKTALKLLEVTNTKQLLDQMINSMDGIIAQQFDSMNLPAEGQKDAKKFQGELIEWFSEFFQWEQMQDLYVEIYTEVFTEKELNELIEFYESPLGKKMLTKMPELMEKSMTKTQEMLSAKMPDLKNKMEKYAAELEKKYKK